jgi:Fe2+ transport system protein FeoA
VRTTLKIDPVSLGALATGRSGVIASLELSSDERAWIEAMGLSPGREVTVLRRGVLGGPLHVRLDTGAEFAVDAELARRVVLAGEAQ